MSNIDERIEQVRKKLGFSTKMLFAEKLGLKYQTYVNYETGKRTLPDKVKAKFLEMGINISWLISGEGEMLIKKENNTQKYVNKTGFKQLQVYSEADLPEGAFVVPLLDQQLCAGSGSQVPEEDASSALVRVPAYLSKYGDKVAALTVDGDSMYPTLHRGDMVVCDSCGWSGEGIYALRMSGSGFVKRLTKAPGKIIILSDNPKYPTREEPEESQDIQIIGRVHCAITKVE